MRASAGVPAAALLALAVLPPAAGGPSAGDPGPLAVRITSPLGRSGVAGIIRIVAQVRAAQDAPVEAVRFYVDAALVGEDRDGPPYAVQWVDENPFEPRRITAEARDGDGNVARDAVRLDPFEIAEVAQVSSVLLQVSVTDAGGRFVRDLGPADFHLAEDGVPQAVDVVHPESVPALYALLVDSSQSMARRARFVRDAAARLVAALRPDDRVLVAPFSKTVGAVTGPTGHRQTALEAISAIAPGGGTAVADGLADVAARLEGGEGRRAVVLLTDGHDEHSRQSIDEAIERAKRSHATVYTVGIAGAAGISLQGEDMLRRVARETGGRAFFPAREHQLPQVGQQVADDVWHRYLVSYTPTNQRIDGGWRALQVTTSDPSHTVRTRPGYFAPEPPPIRPSMEFIVTDADRRYVDVTADDLILLEDGVEQTIDAFHEAVLPISIVLALDESGSMKRSAEAVRAAARGFIHALRPEDSLAVMLFSDGVVFSHDLATERDWSLDALAEYEPEGGTALYDAVAGALARLKREKGRRVVVVLTDGRDEDAPGTGPGSRRTLEEVLARVRDVEATVFALGLGPRVDRDVLERLAGESGGQAYFPTDVTQLEAEYRRILENLTRRYVIRYTSSNRTRDGAWRAVEIRCRVPETLVTSRGGYYAPEDYP